MTFEQLTEPPKDLDLLDQLERNLVSSAEAFIAEVVITGFAIDSLAFECTYNPILAQAIIEAPDSYKIMFGRQLTGAVLNLAAWIAPNLKEEMSNCSETDITIYVFNYIAWLIFIHEVAHITHGHLKYIQQKGSSVYSELSNSKKVRLTHLHHDLEESKRFWRALESEADAYAMSASLATFRYINTNSWWNRLNVDSMVRHHGAMVSATFHFMHVLANGYDDFRHPPAHIRLGISLASIESIAKKMGWETTAMIEETVKGHYLMINNILGLHVDISPQLEAACYMLTLDDVINRAGFAKFRISIL